MKFRVLAIMILFVLFSVPAFAQQQAGVTAAIKSLIDSGTVSSITVRTSAGVLVTGSGPISQEIKGFSLSADYILILEAGNTKFYVDLTRAVAYAYDSKAKYLAIFIL